MLRRDLRVGQGETFDLNLTYKADDGTPIDLTGHSADFLVRERLSGDVIGTFPAILSPGGKIDVKVDGATTAAWPGGQSAYLLDLRFPGGDRRWLLFGALDVVTGVDL